MRATNIYGMSERKYPELDSLFFKFQGTPETIRETSRVVQDLVKKHGATGFEEAKTEEQALDLWADRKNALFSSLALVPGSKGWSTDVCGEYGHVVHKDTALFEILTEMPSLSIVPVSKLPELVYETKKVCTTVPG